MRGFLTSVDIDQDDKFTPPLELDSVTGIPKWNLSPEVAKELSKNKFLKNELGMALGQKMPSKNQLGRHADQALYSLSAVLPTFEKSYIKANTAPKAVSTTLHDASVLRTPQQRPVSSVILVTPSSDTAMGGVGSSPQSQKLPNGAEGSATAELPPVFVPPTSQNKPNQGSRCMPGDCNLI